MISCKGKNKKNPSEVKEVSTEIDLEYFSPFLHRIIPLIDNGFSDSEIDLLLNEFNKLKHDEEKQIVFKIKYNGTESIMKFNLVKEDVDTVLFYLFTIDDLSEKIDKKLFEFFEEKGV